jgi:hypothetical protein
MEFASEMVVKAGVFDLDIHQVPITLHPDGRSRPPHLRTWRDGWRHLRFMLLFSPKWLFLLPGLLLFIAGLVGVLALLPAPRMLGDVRLDTNTLLVASMSTVLGIQVLYCGVLAQQYCEVNKLLPVSRWFRWLRERQLLEAGMVIGLLLISAGVGLLFWSTLQWGETGFGDLSYSQSLRPVISGVMLALIGGQTFFTSFVYGLIAMRND